MSTTPTGQNPASAYSQHVATRLLDFTSPKTPWALRLWDVGSFLALEELYEAGTWVDRRVLKQAAVDWQRRELERLLGDDHLSDQARRSRPLTPPPWTCRVSRSS